MASQNDDNFMPMNSRNPEMWSAIESVIDFEGKSVVDLGCGYGDMLLRVYMAGASSIIGVDTNIIIAKERCRGTPIELVEGCLYQWLCQTDNVHDVAICFSVLPYMELASDVLWQMRAKSRQALIECQYTGDGPGMIHDDEEMRDWLSAFWEKVSKIGESQVKIRDTTRSIWLCDAI